MALVSLTYRTICLPLLITSIFKDQKQSRKREREVSLEPANTPRASVCIVNPSSLHTLQHPVWLCWSCWLCSESELTLMADVCGNRMLMEPLALNTETLAHLQNATDEHWKRPRRKRRMAQARPARDHDPDPIRFHRPLELASLHVRKSELK